MRYERSSQLNEEFYVLASIRFELEAEPRLGLALVTLNPFLSISTSIEAAVFVIQLLRLHDFPYTARISIFTKSS